MRNRLLTVALLSAIPAAAVCQQVAAARTAFAPEAFHARVPRSADSVPVAAQTAEMVLHGALAGAIGALIGFAATVTSVDCADTLRCDFTPLWTGVGIGATVLIPVGVHSAGRRTPWVAKLLVSGLTGAAALGLARHTHNGSLVAMPVAQLSACVAMEHIARARARGDRRRIFPADSSR